VDVRVVAATNANLAERVKRKRFREDLYYRLSAFPLEVPALAERIPDIEALSLHFLRLSTAPNPPPRLSWQALRFLQAHAWYGNVRELQQVVERAAILAQGAPEILAEHFYFPSGASPLTVAAKAV
jgi:DNA-binding NtrC family response regulator